MTKFDVSFSLPFLYYEIEAETSEQALEIAKDRVAEDVSTGDDLVIEDIQIKAHI